MNHSLTTRIKYRASELGFQKVGITAAEIIPEARNNLVDWLAKGNHASMQWLEKRQNERGDIFSYFQEARSIISVGMNYFTGLSKNIVNAELNFSNYAWGDDYHQILKEGLYSLLDYIKLENDAVKGVVCVDTSPVLEKVWAQRAGLGWQGKHTNLISRDYGSWLFLGELILDIKLEYDRPFADDLCGTCTACIDACPTKALEPYLLDARKCISYLTIEHRGDLPEEYDDKLNGWVYGCDICQEVCPWNIKFARSSIESGFRVRTEIGNWSQSDWENMSADEFSRIFKKSPVKRTKYSGLMRNIRSNSRLQ
ncbi:MAG: tRNA epoxyqueuosine(34) reductase QueG [Candidatus Marinimicrobia bacterium]|nr:tRNA epoxyqueuosine(34) reductase QueG [Candidatus Neomarinimicrobiota bacterium]